MPYSAEYQLTGCSRCGGRHQLLLRLLPAAEPSVVLFGGPSASPPAGSVSASPPAGSVAASPSAGSVADPPGRTWPVSFTCPAVGAEALAEITLDGIRSGEILAVTVSEVDPKRIGGLDPLMAAEIEEWTKASASSGRDFCKTMTTLSLGAVPVLFTVFKFLGQDTAKRPWVAVSGAVIGLILLTAAALFAAAMRPVYATVAESDFPQWRARRLARMNQVIRAASITLVVGIASSIAVFATLLTA